MRTMTWFLALLLGLLLHSPLSAQGRQLDKVEDAIEILEQLTRIPEDGIPEKLLQSAEGIAVIPDVVKAGLVFGGRYGKGLLSIRKEDGTWSHPVFITLAGGSVGFQAGVQSTDVILVFKTRRSIEGIVKGKFTLGADAAVAAGPVGRNAQAATDAQLKAEIYSYSRARGLFAGLSIDGSALQIDYDAIEAVYGQGITPRRVFRGKVPATPGIINAFRDTLEELTATTGN